MSSGGEVDFWWSIGIVIIEIDIKQESSMAIRCPIRPHDKCLHKIDSVLITPDINCIGVLVRQSSGDISQFLSQSDHFGLIGLVVSIEVGCIVMLDLGCILFHVDVVKPQVLHQQSILLV